MRHSFGRWQSQNCFSCWSSSNFAFFKLKPWGSWVYLEDKLEKIKFVYISEEALMDSSASGSSKRARALCGSGTQIPSCLVDGCTADLGKCRDYHRRHKVCELHSKIPRVTIQGQEQPFCQQCSRFHSLEAFDEGKRSCRKRLDGHNRRRRKAQPDSLPTNSGRFFSNVQGTKFIPFGSPELLYTNAAAPAWAGIVRGKTDVLLQSSHSHLDFSYGNIFQGSSSHNYKGEKQFPFIEGGGGQPLVNGLGRVVDSSNRALSLLSSPFQPEAWGIGSNHMAQADSSSIPIAIPVCPADHSLMPNLKGMDGESSSSNATFKIGPDESSTTTTGSGTHHHQTLCLSWE